MKKTKPDFIRQKVRLIWLTDFIMRTDYANEVMGRSLSTS